MPAAMDPNSRVALAEIRGDVKLVLAGQERTHADIATINKRLDVHDGRLGNLEADKNVREGERKGLNIGGRVFLAIVSAVGGGGGVLALIELLK